jgi:quinol monooxygenase YgiN
MSGGKEAVMAKLGLVVRMHAKPGKERELAEFLKDALPMARAEEFMPLWFGLEGAKGVFYIFDAFDDEAGREKHLSGLIATGLMRSAPDLLSEPPHIEKVEVLASKVSKDVG